MRRLGLHALSWSILVTFCAVAQPAAAEVPITDEARRHFEAGVALLQDPDGARYTEAYQEFRTAYASSPSWKILSNLGICAMKLERDGEAVEAFEKYLGEGGAEIDAAEKEQVERDLKTLKASLVNVTMQSTPAGATILDERQPPTGNPVVNRYGPLNDATKVGIKAGRHRITAQLEGRDPAVWEFEAKPGSDETHSFELKEATAAAPAANGPVSVNGTSPEIDRGTSPLRIASYAAFGVGVVGLGAGTIFALNAKSDADEADDLCGGSRAACELDAGSSDADKVTQLNEDSGSSKTLAIVGFAVGGVGVAAGITLFVLSSNSGGTSETPAAAGPRITPWIGFNSAGVAGKF